MSLAYYQEKLSSLNVDRSSGHPKPHKVCLLFAIIDLIDKGSITQNRIELNDDLKAAFTFHFEKLKKGNDANNINQPFYHLQSRRKGDGGNKTYTVLRLSYQKCLPHT